MRKQAASDVLAAAAAHSLLTDQLHDLDVAAPRAGVDARGDDAAR